MARVRVVRLLEYTYNSLERAEADMLKWARPTVRSSDAGMTMRSTHLGPYPIPDTEE